VSFVCIRSRNPRPVFPYESGIDRPSLLLVLRRNRSASFSDNLTILYLRLKRLIGGHSAEPSCCLCSGHYAREKCREYGCYEVSWLQGHGPYSSD